MKRNLGRFPSDFMFQLTSDEIKNLRSQNATSSSKHGGSRYMPLVFTEQGVAMLSSVLNSERAIQANIAIMRAFVKLRGYLSIHSKLADKLKEINSKLERHDDEIKTIFNAIHLLVILPDPKKRR